MNNSDPSILIVYNELPMLKSLELNLGKHGFNVYTSTNGSDAIKKAKKINPQLILLDVMLPEIDGIETCIELRKINELRDTIIAFLTSRNEDYTQIIGFEAGADDFIKRPVTASVLITRLKALLKRVRFKEKTGVIEINGLKIIRDKFLVIKDNSTINLPRREFELLFLLASNPKKLFTREEIMSKVWGDDTLVGDKTINVHISRLRHKLDYPIIKTVKGVGYCLTFGTSNNYSA
jgi:two-component system alkaline phosphatase synthesis response regulator PhoP